MHGEHGEQLLFVINENLTRVRKETTQVSLFDTSYANQNEMGTFAADTKSSTSQFSNDII